MKTSIPWLIAGGAFGVAAYLIFSKPVPQYATGYDSVEDAAGKAAAWGAKQRVSGTGTNLLGKVKEGVGRLAGDPDLADDGAGDQAIGTLKDAAGQVAGAVSKTIHDLNT